MKSLILSVWIIKEGLKLDENISFEVDGTTKMLISKINSVHPTVELRLEKTVTINEYQKGLLGKYVYDLRGYLKRYLQAYSAKNGLEYGLSISDEDISNNEIELYEQFREDCEKSGLEPLLKPTGISATAVHDNISGEKLLALGAKMPTDESIVTLVLDWYNVGLVQRFSLNKFMHFFIPLELLATDYISNQKMSWRKEHSDEYRKLKEVTDAILKSVDEGKWTALTSTLSDLPLSTKIERYLKAIFSESEINGFWDNNTYVTFNAKHTWKLYSQMNKISANKSKTDLFNVTRKLIKVRNDIVHYGLRDIENEDIYLIEGILRAIIRKSLS
ncbi:hypothetical protein C4561_02835 [candidate division WWE3 bacterium]|jgi:hypothetical protein|uniref:Uncharacterized protein n=1 Tax=candidate division WWE3 bacterium TaxID=2053526 RepID=A0A3A4ZD99_UNCKA|nr:MAG: hypothetical protein C4561_02835 [candidate division WWE3 bacterium]